MYQPFRRKNIYPLIIILVLLGITLSLPPVRNLWGGRSATTTLLYPFQIITHFVWEKTTGSIDYLFNLRNLASENTNLKKELDSASARLKILDELTAENQRLRDVLRFRSSYWRNLIPAQVVAKINSPWFSIIQIDKGTSSGIKEDLPVINKDGLVGRIIEVSPFSSKVMLIVDPESSVAALDQRSRDFGVAKGAMPFQLFLKYVSTGGDIQTGDLIVTSAASELFPAGIPIGRVSTVSKAEHDLFYSIELKPVVDFSKLEEVFIVY